MRHGLTLLAIAAALAGCAGSSAPPVPAVDAATSYRLGAGDRLRIGVFGEERLTKEYNVGADGSVDVELAGRLPAAGLTAGEFAEKVAAAYRNGYLKEPRVVAEVVLYRPFFILGEVLKPGQYPFVPGLTLSQAVATAGGYTYRAKKSELLLTRAGGTEAVLHRNTPGAMILPGDTVTIPERHF